MVFTYINKIIVLIVYSLNTHMYNYIIKREKSHNY
jgi:hypothetical protein